MSLKYSKKKRPKNEIKIEFEQDNEFWSFVIRLHMKSS